MSFFSAGETSVKILHGPHYVHIHAIHEQFCNSMVLDLGWGVAIHPAHLPGSAPLQ